MFYFEQMLDGSRNRLTREEYNQMVFVGDCFHVVKTNSLRVLRRGTLGQALKQLPPEPRHKYGGRGNGDTWRGG